LAFHAGDRDIQPAGMAMLRRHISPLCQLRHQEG